MTFKVKVKSLKLQMFTDFNGVSKEGHIERKWPSSVTRQSDYCSDEKLGMPSNNSVGKVNLKKERKVVFHVVACSV